MTHLNLGHSCLFEKSHKVIQKSDRWLRQTCVCDPVINIISHFRSKTSSAPEGNAAR